MEKGDDMIIELPVGFFVKSVEERLYFRKVFSRDE
jgi:hypothetical protein